MATKTKGLKAKDVPAKCTKYVYLGILGWLEAAQAANGPAAFWLVGEGAERLPDEDRKISISFKEMILIQTEGQPLVG